MDASDLESRNRLLESQRGLQELLCRADWRRGFMEWAVPDIETDSRLHCNSDLIELPKRWREPRLVFVNSMSDLFHEQVPRDFIEHVFATMRACPQHTFQILTKRSARLRQLGRQLEWPSNVWMGVSVEDARVLYRIFDLKSVRAAIRFLPCEPLIGPLDELPLDDIHWVIVGGESGPGARPMKIEWIRAIFRQCRKAKVPFFFKQWGGVRKDLTGRELGGRTYDEMPKASVALRPKDERELVPA